MKEESATRLSLANASGERTKSASFGRFGQHDRGVMEELWCDGEQRHRQRVWELLMRGRLASERRESTSSAPFEG